MSTPSLMTTLCTTETKAMFKYKREKEKSLIHLMEVIDKITEEHSDDEWVKPLQIAFSTFERFHYVLGNCDDTFEDTKEAVSRLLE